MIYSVFHYSFQTDDVRPTTTLVEAASKEDALDIYNRIALTRLNYPYNWNVTTIDMVFEPEILR